MADTIVWSTKSFQQLSTDELYAILRLRSEVFVVEQKCIFLDLDNCDQEAFHTMGWLNGELVATTRLFDVDKSYPTYQSIGRVACSPKFRGLGLGKRLLKFSLEECERLFGKGPIKIGAQKYLIKFYSEFGFVSQDDFYDEDGIDHVHMIRS